MLARGLVTGLLAAVSPRGGKAPAASPRVPEGFARLFARAAALSGRAAVTAAGRALAETRGGSTSLATLLARLGAPQARDARAARIDDLLGGHRPAPHHQADGDDATAAPARGATQIPAEASRDDLGALLVPGPHKEEGEVDGDAPAGPGGGGATGDAASEAERREVEAPAERLSLAGLETRGDARPASGAHAIPRAEPERPNLAKLPSPPASPPDGTRPSVAAEDEVSSARGTARPLGEERPARAAVRHGGAGRAPVLPRGAAAVTGGDDHAATIPGDRGTPGHTSDAPETDAAATSARNGRAASAGQPALAASRADARPATPAPGMTARPVPDRSPRAAAPTETAAEPAAAAEEGTAFVPEKAGAPRAPVRPARHRDGGSRPGPEPPRATVTMPAASAHRPAASARRTAPPAHEAGPAPRAAGGEATGSPRGTAPSHPGRAEAGDAPRPEAMRPGGAAPAAAAPAPRRSATAKAARVAPDEVAATDRDTGAPHAASAASPRPAPATAPHQSAPGPAEPAPRGTGAPEGGSPGGQEENPAPESPPRGVPSGSGEPSAPRPATAAAQGTAPASPAMAQAPHAAQVAHGAPAAYGAPAAPAAGPSPALASPGAGAAWQAAVVEQVASQLAALPPGRSVSLALDPPELGRVFLRFVQERGRLRVRVRAERADVASQLARDIGRLESAIGRHDLPVRVEIVPAGGEPGGGAPHGGGGRGAFAPEGGPHSRHGQEAAPGPGAVSADEISSRPADATGRLDVLA